LCGNKGTIGAGGIHKGREKKEVGEGTLMVRGEGGGVQGGGTCTSPKQGGAWGSTTGSTRGQGEAKKTHNGNYVNTTVGTLICCQKKNNKSLLN
jgi:hypothetical protein